MHGREAWCVQKRGVVGMVADILGCMGPINTSYLDRIATKCST